MKPILYAAAALAALSAAPGFAQETEVTGKTVVARVNGTEITLAHVAALRSRLPAQYQNIPDEVLFPAVLEQLIQHEVVAQTMRNQIDARTRLVLENEERALLATQLISRISEDPVGEDEVNAAYNAQYQGDAAEVEWNASHILVETRERAEELIALLYGGADFASLAKEHSTGPSGPRGGELGWFSTGMMVPEFEQAVSTLDKGGVSMPVQTQFGWHVVKLNDSRPVAPPPLDEVREQIVDEIIQTRVATEIDRLMAGAQIERPEVDVDPAIIRDVSVFDD